MPGSLSTSRASADRAGQGWLVPPRQARNAYISRLPCMRGSGSRPENYEPYLARDEAAKWLKSAGPAKAGDRCVQERVRNKRHGSHHLHSNVASEDRAHDLRIMRPTRCQLRYCHHYIFPYHFYSQKALEAEAFVCPALPLCSLVLVCKGHSETQHMAQTVQPQQESLYLSRAPLSQLRQH